MNPKVKLTLHIIAQILAQSAIADLVPAHFKAFLAAAVAVVGVLVAFADNPNGPQNQIPPQV